MAFKQHEWRIVLRVMLLLITLSLPAIVLVKGLPELLVFIGPLLLYQVLELIRFLRQSRQELIRFIESIQYRDFSRHFAGKEDSAEIQELRKGYDQVISTFKAINQEKETQFQNLQKIMEMVEPGIISFDPESGRIVLMNESMKALLHVPFLKNIQSLAKREVELTREIQELPAGQSIITTVHAAHTDKSPVKVLLSASSFQNEGKTYKLVSVQNVNEALDETESKAWQKLLNVMTHEIMNSVAPISSLANTLKNRLTEPAIKEALSGDMEDLEVGISTIKRRSEGLLRFAETYRHLNKITTLNLNKVFVKDLFLNLHRLMQPTLAQKNITLEITVKDPDLSLQVDPNLLDQVLINLLVNAIEAVKDLPEPKIMLSAYSAADRKKVLKIADNGIGMSKEVQEKIFVPFFSTKKQGSGIGLSLCKQIVMLHRGTIQVKSEEGEGTAFTLRFN